ncbi:MAG: PspA/IM30 family protein [Candidatus Microthrix parvicella]|jgi:phage shock protein A|nr:PspA/IM30 family protein [Candidatus Microthrix parvicella]
MLVVVFKSIKRFWKYLTTKLNMSFDANADPKVQLEQAIAESQQQHKMLVEQAATVVANQKQTEMRLDARMDDLEKLTANARQAVLMADEATRSGDTAKATEMTSAAEAFANRLIAIEAEIEQLKGMHLQATQASDQAKAAVAQNSSKLQKKLAEKQQLLSQLDQAKMQESMNNAMTSLSATVGDDVPTLDQVREKIEGRYAKAQGVSELQGQSVESKMLEVEQATRNVEAQARLSKIRSQLGLDTGTADASEVEAAPAAQPDAAQPSAAQPDAPDTGEAQPSAG